ncbi:MAG TPA: AAA family ATPase, partial [Thermomicrobiaceae bacterium]|nr:AAA family ATPase [Thermomicrobiaceae bacterium]
MGTPTPPTDDAPATRDQDVAVYLLGEFRVEIGGRPIEPGAWRLRKAAQLVKLLALAPGHRLHRDQIAEHLWPELDPDAAQRNLHQVLFAARRILEPGRSARAQATILPLRQQMLALQPAGALWVDVEAFQAAAAAAQGAGDPAAYEAALALYAGDLLPDELYEEWAAQPREALHETFLRLLVDLARLSEARGELERAIVTWERLVAADAAREEAHVGLMRAYALAGRRQQALRQYQRLRAALARELDAEPEPEATELYQRILGGRFPEAAAERPAPVPARPVAATAPTPASTTTTPSLRLLAAASGLIDRRRELDILQRSLEEMLGGQGRAVLISGDPGIGKSRIIEELSRYAEARGVRTAWGRCYEGEGAPAYWPWIQIIRHELAGETGELREDLGPDAATIAQIVPEIRALLPGLAQPPALDPAQARFRLFDGVTAFLKRRAARRPLLLVLDDLHWADDSSLRLLDFLAAEIAATPILIAGAYRQAEVEERGPLAQTLARLSRLAGGERLRLSGLDEPGVASFSELALGRPAPPDLVTAVFRKSEGNPLFIRELVRLVRDEARWGEPQVGSWLDANLPPQVQDVINLRLVRLATACLELLTIAAVVGREFELRLVARIAAVPVAAALEQLDEAMRAGIIEEVLGKPGCLRFTHVLIPETLYAGLTPARRAGLHAR